MFCNQCGQKNVNDAKFCSGCGKKLEKGNTLISEGNRPNQIELWNPNIAFILGFFFTFIFTSVIIQENWKKLGFQKRMLGSNIMIILLFLFSLYGLYVMQNLGNNFLKSFYLFYPTILGLNIWFMVLLYFISAKTQIEYIAFNCKNYQKKSFIEYSLLAPIFIVMFYFQFKLIFLN